MLSAEDRFAGLYADAVDDVLRFCCRRADRSDAEDATHETFLVAWRRFDHIPPDRDGARAWLFAVARNCLLNTSRGNGRRAALDVRIATTLPGHRESDEQLVDTRVDLARAWQLLTDDQREVLALALWENLPAPQAALVLGVSAGAYRVRLSRARRALRRLIAAGGPDEGRPAPHPSVTFTE